jgi:hypothetical protein
VTPFMLRIEELLESGGEVTEPELRESRPRTIGEGAHEQVELRSLAEQLVSEANAVLAAADRSVELVDEPGADALAFSLRHGESWAQVVTSFADHQSWGRLVTRESTGERQELTGPDALPDLVIALIATASDTATATDTASGPAGGVR